MSNAERQAEIDRLNERVAGLVREMSVMRPSGQGFKDRRAEAEGLVARRKRLEASK